MNNKNKNKMAKATKGKGPKVIPSTLNDLALTISGGTVTCTVSPDAQWAGIQKFVDPATNDGAIGIWEAQKNYNTPPPAPVLLIVAQFREQVITGVGQVISIMTFI